MSSFIQLSSLSLPPSHELWLKKNTPMRMSSWHVHLIDRMAVAVLLARTPRAGSAISRSVQISVCIHLHEYPRAGRAGRSQRGTRSRTHERKESFSSVRVVREVGAEPPLGLCDGHPLPPSVVLDLVLADLAHLEVGGERVGKDDRGDGRGGEHRERVGEADPRVLPHLEELPHEALLGTH